MNTKLEQIQTAAQRFAAARLALVTTVQEYNDAVQLTKDKYWPKIKKLAGETGEERSKLSALIDLARELFTDPRTLIVDGIKFGLKKGKGKMTADSEEKVIERIKKLFPKRVKEFVRTTESLDKGALANLDARELRSIGISITDAEDQIVITAVDGDVEKLVAAVLKETEGH